MEHQPSHGGESEMVAEETAKQSSPEEVFGVEGLPGEILDLVDSPTTLVRAALVSKRWYSHAAEPAFLGRFRKRHPPRLLGFYVTGGDRTEFVPMLPTTELTVALYRAGSVFDAFHPNLRTIYDSRNGRVLFKGTKKVDYRHKLVLSDTLRRTDDGAMRELALPPEEYRSDKCLDAMILLPEDNNAVCYRVEAYYTNTDGPRLTVEVFELQLCQDDGKWKRRCFNSVELTTPEGIAPKVVLTGSRVYMLAKAGYLIRVDVDNLGWANVFTIKLPEGVTYNNQNLSLCRSDDEPALYLIHMTEGKLLSVWLLTANSIWVLKDTVSVEATCGHLLVAPQQGSEPPSAADADTSISVVGAGDNAEFVFLQHGGSGAVVYLHLGSTRAEKVYQVSRNRQRPHNRDTIQVQPFHMVWPPVFPARLR